MQKCKNAKVGILFLVVVVAIGMLACGDDKTELSWTNETTVKDTLSDIQWSANSGAYKDWNDNYSYGQTTESKEVADSSGDDLTGTGYCAIGGLTGDILINGEKTIVLSKGSTNNYVIEENTATKK